MKNLLVERYERKFLVSNEIAMVIQKKIRNIMHQDNNGQNGNYVVRSLYSINNSDFYDKLDGWVNRFE